MLATIGVRELDSISTVRPLLTQNSTFQHPPCNGSSDFTDGNPYHQCHWMFHIRRCQLPDNSQLPLAFNTYSAVVLSVQPCCNYFVMGTLWDFAICASVMCKLCYCFYFTSPESQVIFCSISPTWISPFHFLQPYKTWLPCKKGEEGPAQIWKLEDPQPKI